MSDRGSLLWSASFDHAEELKITERSPASQPVALGRANRYAQSQESRARQDEIDPKDGKVASICANLPAKDGETMANSFQRVSPHGGEGALAGAGRPGPALRRPYKFTTPSNPTATRPRIRRETSGDFQLQAQPAGWSRVVVLVARHLEMDFQFNRSLNTSRSNTNAASATFGCPRRSPEVAIETRSRTMHATLSSARASSTVSSRPRHPTNLALRPSAGSIPARKSRLPNASGGVGSDTELLSRCSHRAKIWIKVTSFGKGPHNPGRAYLESCQPVMTVTPCESLGMVTGLLKSGSPCCADDALSRHEAMPRYRARVFVSPSYLGLPLFAPSRPGEPFWEGVGHVSSQFVGRSDRSAARSSGRKTPAAPTRRSAHGA